MIIVTLHVTFTKCFTLHPSQWVDQWTILDKTRLVSSSYRSLFSVRCGMEAVCLSKSVKELKLAEDVGFSVKL